MTEAWLAVVGYEGLYEVSNYGRVRRIEGSRRTPVGRILRPRKNAKGYMRVALHARARRDFSVHRIVLIAFVGPAPTETHEGNHRDGCKANNCLANLEWVTPQENVRHACATGLRQPLRGEKNGRAKLSLEQVREIRRLRGLERQRDIAAGFGVSKSLVGQIQRGEIWPEIVRVLSRDVERTAGPEATRPRRDGNGLPASRPLSTTDERAVFHEHREVRR